MEPAEFREHKDGSDTIFDLEMEMTLHLEVMGGIF